MHDSDKKILLYGFSMEAIKKAYDEECAKRQEQPGGDEPVNS